MASWRQWLGATAIVALLAGCGSGKGAPADARDAATEAPVSACIVGDFPVRPCDQRNLCGQACGDLCVDSTTDPSNCGGCDVACAAQAACRVGACGPVPTDLVPASTNPTCGSIDLAVAEGTLTWADRGNGTIQSMDLASGARQTLVAMADTPTNVAVVGSSVFWIEGRRTIRRLAGTQPPNVVVAAPSDIGAFVVSADGTSVFYSIGGDIQRVPSAGGTPVLVAREEQGGHVPALALSGNRLAFDEQLAGSGIYLVTLVDGVVASCGGFDANFNSTAVNCLLLGRDYHSDELLFFAAGGVMWADAAEVDLSPAVAGSSWNTIAVGNSSLTGLAVTSSAVYSSESGDLSPGAATGIIEEAPLTSASDVRPPFVVIARGQRNPRSLAADATRVYWSTDDCAIRATGL